MDASTRPNEPACPNVNAFIVSPAGDCALPARLRVQAERLRAVREQMEARDAEIEAAESRLRSKVGLLVNSATSGPARRTMRCTEPSR